MKQEDHLSTKLKANLRNKVRLHLKKKRIKGGKGDGRSEHETHVLELVLSPGLLGTSAPVTTHTLASVSQQLAVSVVRY